MAAVKTEKPVSGPVYTYNNPTDKYYESRGGVNPEWEMSAHDAEAYRASTAKNSAGGYIGSGGLDGYGGQLAALRRAQDENKKAREAAYNQGVSSMNSLIDSGKSNAYVAMRKQQELLPQAMAASGYTGGQTESSAGDLAAQYQNALKDLDLEKARRLAELQANLETGNASDAARFNSDIANAIASIEQQQRSEKWQQLQFDQQQRQQQFENNLALQQFELQKQKAGGGGSAALSGGNQSGGNGQSINNDRTTRDILEQLSMFKTKNSKVDYIERLFNAGAITSAQANYLMNSQGLYLD